MSSSSSSSSNPSSRRNCRQITLAEIEDATNNFHESNILGHGGEGTVYLAKIKLDWNITEVAVKLLKPDSEEFVKEINTISKIQHPNLVSLLGYCDELGHKILIYEYMKHGSLSDYVKQNSPISLSWHHRLHICLNAARGLQYLHSATDELPKGIIHRDVKPDNILLGEKGLAKISDFGMFKLSHASQIQSTTITNLKGTGGYYAPEYITYRTITRKIDVYAFGVVLFQVLCLKMPWDRGDESYYITDDEDLGIWAQQNVDPKIKAEISDESLRGYTDIIGKSLKRDPRKRPTMVDVVLGLEKLLKFPEIGDEIKSSEYFKTAGSSRVASSVISKTITVSEEYNEAIVLDIGESITKAGTTRDGIPKAVFATGEVTSSNPVKDGIVAGWSAYGSILNRALRNELSYGPENKRPVLLTEPPLKHNATDGQKADYKTNREMIIKVMFDVYDVPALYIGIQPVLSLFAHGKTTGLVIESGEGVSHSVPIYEGYVLPHAITSLPLAGRGVTDILMKLLNEQRDYSFDTQADYDIVRDLKEKMAYVALNYKAELRKSKKMNESYTLPDGKLISIGQELFECAETLFDPSMIGIDEPGIHENTYESIILCNEEIRDELCRVIVLSGGSTLLTGFRERMEKEIRGFAPSGTDIKILADRYRNYQTWMGGSILAQISSFDKMCVTRKEYEEYGPSIVHTKFF